MAKKTNLNKRNSSGFTLIELAVALGIAGLLMYFAIPAYSDFSQRQALSNEANNLLGDLGYARSLAIENGSTVTVTSVSGDLDWSSGWNINESLPGGGFVVVRSKGALPNNISMIATSTASPVTPEIISYNSIGVISTPVTTTFNIQITPDFPNFLSISVQPSGMASANRTY